jgi:hypothetical protein
MAIFGLALVGSACAASSRNMFGGSVSPTLPPTIKTINERNWIAPVPRSAQRPPARSTTWPRVKSNQPTIGPPKAAPRPPLPRASAPATPPAGQAVPNQAVPRSAVAANPPAPRLTVAAAPERPGQSDGADVTAASSNHEHLAAVPVAHANADSTAAVTAPVVASGYAGSSYVGAQ